MQRDVILLFTARSVRLFAYGALSVVLALYLHEAGLSGSAIGLLFTLTLAGDAGISLWITTTADRLGRKRMLILGAGLMVMAGVVFSLTGNPVLLMLAGIIGVISPSGNEIGPFLSLEQAALSQLLPSEKRVRVFAWYNLAGSLATACGALVGGFFSRGLMQSGFSELASYRASSWCTLPAVPPSLSFFCSFRRPWRRPLRHQRKSGCSGCTPRRAS